MFMWENGKGLVGLEELQILKQVWPWAKNRRVEWWAMLLPCCALQSQHTSPGSKCPGCGAMLLLSVGQSVDACSWWSSLPLIPLLYTKVTLCKLASLLHIWSQIHWPCYALLYEVHSWTHSSSILMILMGLQSRLLLFSLALSTS